MSKKENNDYEVILKIADRAVEKDLQLFDKLSLVMDLEFANNKFDLRLEELLNADDEDFIHDIQGIQNHIDREKEKWAGIFEPRFASY